MVFDDYFLVVPVYRLKEDEYYAEMNKDCEKLLPNTWDDSFRKANPGLVRGHQQHHRTSYGGDWEFNEIIGYIKLYFMGTQVRGEYWSTVPHRKVRTRKKQFEYKSHKLSTECEIQDQSSQGVLSAVEEYLDRCSRQLKDRHLDFREFSALKNHIDWEALSKSANTLHNKALKSQATPAETPQSGAL